MSHKALIWIDQNECMGAGTCEQIAPEMFRSMGDGLWAVIESPEYFEQPVIFDGGNGPGHGPLGSQGMARVPTELMDLALEVIDECPGECVYVETAV